MTKHDPAFRVQLPGIPAPGPGLTEKATVPCGTLPVPGEASVTVAVHTVDEPAATEAGLQTTAVEVERLLTVKVTLAVRDWPLFVPVTVTVKIPVAEKVHDSIAVWSGGRVTLGAIEQLRLFCDKATAPEKPPRPVTEMVEVPV